MSERTQQRRKQLLQKLRPYPKEIYRGANFFQWLEERTVEQLEKVFQDKISRKTINHILTKRAETCENNSVKFWSYCSLENRALLVEAYYNSTNRELGITRPASAPSPYRKLHYHVAILIRGQKEARLFRDFYMPIYDDHDTVKDAIKWYNIINSSGNTIDVKDILGLFWRLLSTEHKGSHLHTNEKRRLGEATQLHRSVRYVASQLVLLVELDATAAHA